MGTCTSTSRHQQKQHKRTIPKNSVVLDNKQLLPLPLTRLPNQQSQRPQSLLNDLDCSSSCFARTILHQADRNSLIQLYSSNTNNNNNNNHHLALHQHFIQASWMSSSASTSQVAPRIPVPKSRLPVHRPESSSTGSIKSPNTISTISATNPKDLSRPMSTPNRTPLPSSSQNTTQPRSGFIPRPLAPTIQQAQASSLAEHSRSISPSSTVSAKSSASSSLSQRLTKTQTIPKATVIPSSNATNTSKSKIPPARSNKILATTTTKPVTTTTTTNRIRPNPSVQPPPTANVNIIRDRYKTQTRMNFFTRRTSTTNSLISPSNDTSVIKEESSEQPFSDEPSNDTTSNDLTTESFSRNNLTYTNHHRAQAASTLSSSSLVSDLSNQDAVLDDDKCSLKSDDLLCGFDDTLTLDSVSKNDQSDSCSSISLRTEVEKKPTNRSTVPPLQSVLKEHRPATVTKPPTVDAVNGNLRESLDELTQLSHRMDNIVDGDHTRKLLTRSVSLKPPPASLPPREDAEQISMDIESYRQVMKDVMVVKTVLHQLDRLLKHSDGANMTESMVGSFHESMTGSRRYSSSGGGDCNLRNSIDENSSYDDLMKEVVVLRKEREQDRQTIKLLQEQMYKYSSHTNGQ